MGTRSISKKVRFDVFKRDAFTCQYCGAHPPSVVLEVDHIHPVAEGGDDAPENLITACFNCNRGKGAALLTVATPDLAQRSAELAEREAQLAGYSALMQIARERREDEAWQVAEILKPGASEGYSTRNLDSIKRFIDRLGVAEVIRAADIARSKPRMVDAARFKYFCGVCWRFIRGDEPQ